MSTDPRPLVIIDTSVFVADALGHERGSSSQVLAVTAAGTCLAVMSAELWDETRDKLHDPGGIPPDAIEDRYSSIMQAALWVEPVEETAAHRAFVAEDPDDTVLPRMAEAVYGQFGDQATTEHKFIVSLNKRHVRPGSNWAGFLCITPHGLMAHLTAEDE